MEDFILVWKEGESTVFSNNAFFHGIDKPELSFGFDVLHCETPTNVYFRMVGENQFLLTEDQVNECCEWCKAFYENGDYAVFAYDPAEDNLYKGQAKKSECVEKGWKWAVDERPETDAAAWDDETGRWKIFYAAIMEDGHMRTAITSVCAKCVLLLTRDEYEAFPKPGHKTDTWDFEKEEWVDARDLATVRKNALLDIRTKFEAVRWKAMNEYVPDYERETWRLQLEEARAFQADPSAETPFIDLFLEARTDYDVPTKEELVADILADNDVFLKTMAEASAKLWSWKKRIAACSTGYEVDAVADDFAAWYAEERKA